MLHLTFLDKILNLTYNKDMERFFLKTSDGIKLALNHYKTNHKEVVIIVHGWFMTKDSKAFSNLAADFSKYYDVISFDCRGHGKSSGFYTFTEKENIDLKAVVDFAKQNYKKIYLAGFSLGGAIVLIHSALYNDVDKIIAVSAPSDFNKIENQMWKKEAWLPTLKKYEPARWFSVRPSFYSLVISSKINPIDIIKYVKSPTLFIAGKKDPTVHPWHTKKLYEEAVCEKQFEIFNSNHSEDLYLDDPEKFMDLCFNWLNSFPKPSPNRGEV